MGTLNKKNEVLHKVIFQINRVTDDHFFFSSFFSFLGASSTFADFFVFLEISERLALLSSPWSNIKGETEQGSDFGLNSMNFYSKGLGGGGGEG